MEYGKFIKSSSVAFLIAAMIMFFLPQKWNYFSYQSTYLGFVFLASFVVAYIPHEFLSFDDEVKKDLIEKAQASVTTALILNGLGEIGLYKSYLVGFEYDKLAHMLNSLLFTVMLGEVFIVLGKKYFQQMIWRVTSMVFGGGMAWELWEILSDVLFHSNEWGVYGQNKITDTIGDMIWNGVGIVLGMIILKIIIGEKFLEKR